MTYRFETNDLVSIIVPVYNMEKYLVECLDSIINQTYGNLEIIIVNDGSTDGSTEIIDDYRKRDQRIKVITKENGGLSSARNAGINVAEGEYLYFIDSDDYLEINAIEKLYETIIQSEVDLVTFECCTFSKTDNVNPDIYKRTLKEGIYNGHEYFSYCQAHNEFHPTIWLHFYKREVFENRRFIEGIVYEDSPFTFEVLTSDVKIFFLQDVLVNHRIEKGSIIRSGMTNNKVRSNIIGIETMIDVYQKDVSHTKEQWKFISWCASTHYTAIRKLEVYDNESKAMNRKFRTIISTNLSIISFQLIKEWIKLLISKPKRIV